MKSTHFKNVTILGAYNETKYDNVARTLAMMEEELKRTDERVRIAETRVVDVEAELGNIGDNQKQLEVSEEKARKREEKYQDQIKQLNIRYMGDHKLSLTFSRLNLQSDP